MKDNQLWPFWLNFNQDSLQFSGTGPQDINSYEVIVFATDGITDPVNDTIVFQFSANAPELNALI